MSSAKDYIKTRHSPLFQCDCRVELPPGRGIFVLFLELAFWQIFIEQILQNIWKRIKKLLSCFSWNFHHLFLIQPAICLCGTLSLTQISLVAIPFWSTRSDWQKRCSVHHRRVTTQLEWSVLGMLSIRIACYKYNLAWAQQYSYSERGLYRYIWDHLQYQFGLWSDLFTSISSGSNDLILPWSTSWSNQDLLRQNSLNTIYILNHT